MKNRFLIIFLLLAISTMLLAQVGINTDDSQPDPAAMLDVKSSTKGVLLPRLSQAQISAVPSPANGLIVFCTDDNKIYIYISIVGRWKELAFGPGTIVPPFTCGASLTINHIVGDVAPVNKTVTYTTVTNIPGEPFKCWITSNLGSDHQATAVNDATEESAGWYWQFNRKQGYKHDGTVRIPNSVWIDYISEDFDWQASKDPCTIELGSEWRIPTYAEWFNVDQDGNWINWNGPWNSSLKLHSAGALFWSNGTLSDRGSIGHYWSGNQLNWYMYAWSLYFSSGYCQMDGDGIPKASGYSMRCVKL